MEVPTPAKRRNPDLAKHTEWYASSVSNYVKKNEGSKIMNEQVLDELYKKWAYSQLAIEIKAEEGGRITQDPRKIYD